MYLLLSSYRSLPDLKNDMRIRQETNRPKQSNPELWLTKFFVQIYQNLWFYLQCFADVAETKIKTQGNKFFKREKIWRGRLHKRE